MLQIFLNGALQPRHFRTIGLRLFIVVMIVFFFVYSLLRLCLYGEPLSVKTEFATVCRMLMVAAGVSASAMVLLCITEVVDRVFRKKKLRAYLCK